MPHNWHSIHHDGLYFQFHANFFIGRAADGAVGQKEYNFTSLVYLRIIYFLNLFELL